ncbi:MAG TPA: ribonuclease HII [Parasegetibacter sp.]|jgi:ribonuclease HII
MNKLSPFFQDKLLEAGCDEAGRGCFAGPVFAAAVILPRDFYHPLLNDSKQLKESERESLVPIIEKEAISYAIAMIDNEEIDRINILKASFKAMHLAIASLDVTPELLLIDGNRFTPYPAIPHHCIIKGDGLYASIAAASILAKTYRDAYMKNLHEEFPVYNWKKNKGYGTNEHRKAIAEVGICKYHRKTWCLIAGQAELGFAEAAQNSAIIN